MNLHGNKRNASILLLAISLIAMGVGIVEITQHAVDCGAQTMHAGDICQSAYEHGTDLGNTAAQQRTQNIITAVVAFLISVAAGAYAIRNLILLRRSRAPRVIRQP